MLYLFPSMILNFYNTRTDVLNKFSHKVFKFSDPSADVLFLRKNTFESEKQKSLGMYRKSYNETYIFIARKLIFS